MSHILIAGGTGLVGSRLSELLRERGYEVALLSRTAASRGEKSYVWDPARDIIDPEALGEAMAVINLAGAGIADRLWTSSRKRVIIESRTQSAQLLRKALLSSPNRVETYLSASAIGIYGDTGDAWTDEDSAPGRGFLAESTQAWEASFHEIEALASLRAAAFRIGIVLSPEGGALEKMLLPFKVRVGTFFGDGRQWYSWVHIDDICRMFIHALENTEMRGIYNGVAPQPVTNKTMVEAIGETLGGPNLPVPAPAFLLRAAMGEMADVILNSNRVSSKKIEATGFNYRFPTLREALQDLLKR